MHIGHVLTRYSILYHEKVVSQVSAYWACINTLLYIISHEKVVSQVSAYWACINTLLYIISRKGCESGECILGMY